MSSFEVEVLKKEVQDFIITFAIKRHIDFTVEKRTEKLFHFIIIVTSSVIMWRWKEAERIKWRNNGGKEKEKEEKEKDSRNQTDGEKKRN